MGDNTVAKENPTRLFALLRVRDCFTWVPVGVALTMMVALLAGGAVLTQAAVAAPTDAPISVKNGGATTFAKAIAAKQTKACSVAKKAVKRAKSPAAKAKAEKRVAKRCAVAPVILPEPGVGVLPKNATGYNADGSVRYGAGFFNNLEDYNSPDYSGKPSPKMSEAIDGVSGVNWRDQSHLAPEDRVGFPEIFPAAAVELFKKRPDLMYYYAPLANLKPGDNLKGDTVLGSSTYLTLGEMVLITTNVLSPTLGDSYIFAAFRINGNGVFGSGTKETQWTLLPGNQLKDQTFGSTQITTFG